MTLNGPTEDVPGENGHGPVTPTADASLDELLSGADVDELVGSRSRTPEDIRWLRWIERITSEGWGPTLRVACLTTLPVVALLILAGVFPALCTTVVLLVARMAYQGRPVSAA